MQNFRVLLTKMLLIYFILITENFLKQSVENLKISYFK